MKKMTTALLLILLLVVGCGSAKPVFEVETAPDFKDGETSSFVVKATMDGKRITGINMIAILEMVKMDHGVIEVELSDNGDGTYTGDVSLSMAGEWIAEVQAEKDGKSYDQVLTFDVKER